MQDLGAFPSYENSNLSNFFQTMFLLARVLTLVLWSEFRQCWTIFGGVRAQYSPQNGHFMDAELVRKTLKTFNITNTTAILMKLTTIMYLYEILSRKPLKVRNSIFAVMST